MEYQVFYLEPWLGWCNYIDPYPEGTVYRSMDEGVTAADQCCTLLKRSVEVWERGFRGSKKVYEKTAMLDE